MAKLQPSVMRLNFRFSGPGDHTIDLSQAASMVNRRFYRQGLQWAVTKFRVLAPTAANNDSIEIFKIPTTWMSSNAWHKTMATWRKQQDEAIAESGSESAVAKFRDFKIHMDVSHVDSGFGDNLLPYDGSIPAQQYLEGEWDASQIVLPNTDDTDPTTGPQLDAAGNPIDIHPTEYFLHMVGVNNNGGISRGMIDGYAASRAYPQSPDPVSPSIGGSDNWLNRMFNDGNANPEILQNASDTNDELPYDQNDYPGGEVNGPGLQYVDGIYYGTNNTGNKWQTLEGGVFPCGLVRIRSVTSVENINFQVVLVPGKHRGYLAEPMQDM